LGKKALLFFVSLFLVSVGPFAARATAQSVKTVRLKRQLKDGQVVRASFALPDGWRLSSRETGSVSLKRDGSAAVALVAITQEKSVIASALDAGRSFSEMGCQVKVNVDEAVAGQGITKVTVEAKCDNRVHGLAIFRAFPGRKTVMLVGLIAIPGPMSQGNTLMRAWEKARLR
jgi:hypothetical protein